MMKFWLTALIGAALPCHLAPAQWVAGPPLAPGVTSRTHAFGVNHGGTLYAIGGKPWAGGDEDGLVHRLLPGAWPARARRSDRLTRRVRRQVTKLSAEFPPCDAIAHRNALRRAAALG